MHRCRTVIGRLVGALYLQTSRPTHLTNTLRLCSLGKGSILRSGFIVLVLLWHSSVIHFIFWVGTKTSKLYQMTMTVNKLSWLY